MTPRVLFNYLIARALIAVADLIDRLPSRRWAE